MWQYSAQVIYWLEGNAIIYDREKKNLKLTGGAVGEEDNGKTTLLG